MKRFRISITTASIESFTFVCEHPENKSYVIVLDEYKKPQRMTKEEWDKISIGNYNDAKKALVEHLKSLIEIYEK